MYFLKKIKFPKEIHPLLKNNYIGRIVYSLTAIIMGIPLMLDLGLGLSYLIAVIASSLVWPHLAFLLASYSKNQVNFEMRFNLNADPAVFGIWIPVSQFNPLLIIFGVVAMGSVGIVTGGIKLLVTRILIFSSVAITGALIIGFNFNPYSSVYTIIAIGFSIILFSYTASFISYNTNNKLSATKKELKIQKFQLETLSSKLSKYLSPQIYNSIFTGKKDVKIETVRKKLTIFFSDIQGFTATTDDMEAEDLSTLLNSYLNEMTKIALKHGGTIDKYIGDAIMIFFGDPETKGEKEDALRCVSMAIEMRKRMTELQENWSGKGFAKPLNIRMGINTGFCTVGNFGSEERLDYTIIGGQVNLASRLESNAQPNQILISQETYLLIKENISCVEMGEIQVKGILKPVMTYQVVDFYDNMDTSGVINESHAGIDVTIDLTKIGSEKAIAILKKTISKIENE